jgi:N utilization substance protein B
MGLRRQAREQALQILFQHDLLKSLAASASSVVDVPPDALPFVERLVQGVQAHREELDALLQRFAEHWSLERMAVVDRNVLRCALYELLYLDDIPAKVTINEAIEIAKRYGSEESGAFVNGILDRIVKSDDRLQSKRLATA